MIVVLALALTGCRQGGPSDTSDPLVIPPTGARPEIALEPRLASGDRLEAVAWESGEVLAFQTFWDTERDSACDFRTAEDGSLRCLPAPDGAELVFLDANCTQPALGKVGSAPRPYETIQAYPEEGDCDGGYVVAVQTGASLPVAPDIQLYRARRDNCLPMSDFVPDTLNAWSPAPPSTFVAGERLPAPAGDAYAVVIEAEDGARRVLGPGLADASSCSNGVTDAGERCLPYTDGTFDVDEGPFADALCTEPVVRTGDLPECSVWTRGVTAQGRTTIYEVLDRYDGDLHVVGMNTGNCIVDNDVSFGVGAAMRVGAAIPSTDWPAVGRAWRGTTSLNQSWITSGDGVPIAPEPGNSLSTDGVPCMLADLAGQTVCVPDPSPPELFADADCTIALVRAPNDVLIQWAEGGEQQVPSELPRLAGVFTSGAPYTGQVYRSTWGSPCEVETSTLAFAAVPFTPATLTRADL